MTLLEFTSRRTLFILVEKCENTVRAKPCLKSLAISLVLFRYLRILERLEMNSVLDFFLPFFIKEMFAFMSTVKSNWTKRIKKESPAA